MAQFSARAAQNDRVSIMADVGKLESLLASKLAALLVSCSNVHFRANH